MVTTKHCCFGVCRSDSRYSDREHMKGVFFIPFPKPGREPEKCQRWVRACKRERFTEKNVTKDTYICSLHFLGGKGPTIDDPDPIPATTTSGQVEKIARKRKAPTQRNEAVSEAKRKRKRLTHNTTPSSSTPSSHETEHESTDLHINDDTTAATALLDLSSVSDLSAQIITDSFDKMDQSCQTDATCDELIKLKLENKIQKDELSKCREQDVNAQQKSTFSVDDVRNDDKQAKFYTGLTWLQFMALWNFLASVQTQCME